MFSFGFHNNGSSFAPKVWKRFGTKLIQRMPRQACEVAAVATMPAPSKERTLHGLQKQCQLEWSTAMLQQFLIVA
eukprot:2833537-Amphidinium_carterae.1